MGVSLGLAKPCFGSTIAMTRESLARIGGFEAFADDLADDYMIGAALRRDGAVVAIPGFTIGHEYVGTVEAIGDQVSSVAVGDRVLGTYCTCCGGCWNDRRGRSSRSSTASNSRSVKAHSPGPCIFGLTI